MCNLYDYVLRHRELHHHFRRVCWNIGGNSALLLAFLRRHLSFLLFVTSFSRRSVSA